MSSQAEEGSEEARCESLTDYFSQRLASNDTDAGFLVTAHDRALGHISAHGQETDDTARLLSKMNMLLHGMDAGLGTPPVAGFQEETHRDLKTVHVLANPPFNMSGWGSNELRDDTRWQYGVPPADNANFAWLQHIVSLLPPHGAAAVVMPNGAASTQRRSEAAIRRRMIEADLIEGIIALPERLFDTTQIAATIWVMNRDKAPDGARGRHDRRGKTLFIDARNLGVMVDRAHRKLTGNDVARVTRAFHAWRGGPGPGNYCDSPGFCSSATTRAIAEHRYVLTPSHYVGGAPGSGQPDERNTQVIEHLQATGWQVSPLAHLVKHAQYLRSDKAPERAAKISELRNEERLVLPIEAHFDATYGSVPEVVIPNRSVLLSLIAEINGTFLAAWLNSADGRQARTAAMPGTARSPRTVSLTNLRHFQDRLVVPVPDPDVQAAIADTTALLNGMRQRAEQLAAEVWLTPSLTAQIQPITRRWLDSAAANIMELTKQ